MASPVFPIARAFDEFLRTLHHAASESGEPFSVLLIDIDQFKRFNEQSGYGVGSAVAADGERAAGTFEREGPACPIWREEFIAVLPGAQLAACEATAERIRKSVLECRSPGAPPERFCPKSRYRSALLNSDRANPG